MSAGHVQSQPLSRQSLLAVLLCCGALGVYGWAVFAATFGHDGSIGPRYNAPGTDWMVFYGAVRSYLDGNLPLIFDGDRFTAYLNAMFAQRLSSPLPFHPWLYPPAFLLLVLPFGMLSFAASYAAFLAVTFAALLWALWQGHVLRDHRWAQLAALLLCPATSVTVVTGQNAFLSGALLVGGFAWLERRPLIAGALLGALSYKPSLCLMVPVALIAARQWRALAAAAASTAILVLASAAIFGAEAWRLWFEQTLTPPAAFAQQWLDHGRLWGLSIYTCARLLGATDGIANAAQALAACLAAAAVYCAFRRPLDLERRLVVILAAAILAAPHVSGYDTLLIAIAAAILFFRSLELGAGGFGYVLLSAAAWLIPLFTPPRAIATGFLAPLIVFALMVAALANFPVRRQSPVEAAAAPRA